MKVTIPTDPYQVQSVIFGPDFIEVNFVDQADVSADRRVVDVRQRLIDPDLVPEQADILLQTIYDMLDFTHAYRRNPRTSFTVGEPDE